MNGKIIFRADGNQHMGYGHVMRMLSLANILKEDFECTFAIHSPDNFLQKSISTSCRSIIEIEKENDPVEFRKILSGKEIVVLDGYHFSEAYQKIIKDSGCRLVCIDDSHDKHYYADIVINHAPGLDKNDFSVESGTRLLLGPQYALIQNIFLEAGGYVADKNKILVCFGGADPHNYSLKVLEHLEMLHFTGVIILVSGNANRNIDSLENFISKSGLNILHKKSLSSKDLLEEMKRCEFAVVPSSTMLYEIAAVRKPVISGWHVENQKKNYSEFLKAGAIVGANDFSLTSFQKAFLAIQDKNEQLRMQKAQEYLIDRKSPERLRKVFISLYVESHLKMRRATLTDIMTYFRWTNDPEVRVNSISSELVTLDTHKQWFESKVNHPDFRLYIFEVDDKPIGQVRLHRDEKNWVINYSVDEYYRGIGAGNFMIKSVMNDQEMKNGAFKALVKPENISSVKIFLRNGYHLSKTEIINGKKLEVYIK